MERVTLTGWGRTAPSSAELVERSGRDVDALAAAVKDLPGARRHRPRPRPLVRRPGAERRRRRAAAARPGPRGRHRRRRGDGDRARPASASTTCCACSCRAAGSCRSRRAPGSSRSAGRSPATSTARTTTSTARSAPTSCGCRCCSPTAPCASCRRRRSAELFWATVGGMGLTGVILDATIRLLPDRRRAGCRVDTERVGDLDTLLAAMERGRPLLPLLGGVDRPDGHGPAPRAQRAHPRRPRHRRPARIRTTAVDPLAYDPRQRVNVPPLVPGAGRHQPHDDQGVQRAVVPQGAAPPDRPDRVDPRLLPPARHGRRRGTGCTGGPGSCSTSSLRAVRRRGRRCATCSSASPASGAPSFLTVLKRFGAANPAPLSFPAPGLDADARRADRDAAGCARCCHALDELVLDAGGRHYLAKDAHITPDGDPPRATPASTSGGRSGRPSTRPASGSATWPAASHLC